MCNDRTACLSLHRAYQAACIIAINLTRTHETVAVSLHILVCSTMAEARPDVIDMPLHYHRSADQ